MDEKKEKTEKVINTVCCSVAALALMLSMMIVPQLATLLGLCVSVFVAYACIKGGSLSGAIVTIVAGGGAILFGDANIGSVLIALTGLLPGLISGFQNRKKTEYYTSLISVITGFALAWIAQMYYLNISVEGGIPAIFTAAEKYCQASVNQAAALLENVSGEEIAEFNKMISLAIESVQRMIPCMLVIMSMILGYIHLMLVEFFVRKIGRIQIDYVKFDGHIAPRHMAYVYVIVSFAVMFTASGGKTEIIASNLVTVLDVIFAFCGLSFIESKFKEKLKYGILRGMIYIAAFFVASSFAITILSLVGLFDCFADYRRIRKW